MNKLTNNLLLAIFFSFTIGAITYSINNKIEFNGYFLGAGIGGGSIILICSLIFSVFVSFVYYLIKKSFWNMVYITFWIAFTFVSFIALFGAWSEN